MTTDPSASARPTITVLAQQLGVSAATVSRAFSRPELLRPETVQRVREAAAAVGYVPNRYARALSTGRAGAVGIIVPDIANPFFPPLIRHVQNLAQERGLTVLLADTDERPDREEAAITLLSHQVEGLLLCSSRLPSAVLRRLAAQHRIVLVNRDVPETGTGAAGHRTGCARGGARAGRPRAPAPGLPRRAAGPLVVELAAQPGRPRGGARPGGRPLDRPDRVGHLRRRARCRPPRSSRRA